MLKNFSLLGREAGCDQPGMIQGYLDNLCRLGLIRIPPLRSYTHRSLYAPLEHHPDVEELIRYIRSHEDQLPKVVRQTIDITVLGRRFMEACVIEHEEFRGRMAGGGERSGAAD